MQFRALVLTRSDVRKVDSGDLLPLASKARSPLELAVMVDPGIDHDAGVPIADTPVVPQWPAFAAKPEAFNKPRRSHVIRMDQSFDSMGVECARTVVEDRPHSLCPEAASPVLRRNYVAQLKATVVGVCVVIGDHTNTSNV